MNELAPHFHVPSFDLPMEDWPAFNALPQRVRDFVAKAKPVLEAWMAVRSGKGIVARDAARLLCVSRQKLWTLQTRFKKEGWRGLIDRRALGNGSRKVKAEFIPVWHGYVLANQRNSKRAHARMCREAAGGKAIAGYADWQEWPKPPPGLDYRNLIRKRYMPAVAEIMLARRGISAARAALPCVWQDVSEVRPLEYVLFDDVELDFLVLLPGSFTPCKLRMIVAFDLCSRRVLGYGVRPGITREDGKEDSLKLTDMKAVVVRFLRSFGMPSAYTMHFICERGTAAIKDAFKAALEEVSLGMIAVHDTSMIAGRVLGFADGAVGNSWGKGWLESHFNPLHSEYAHLDGQKGRRYDLAPRELDGRRKECTQLWKAGRTLEIAERNLFQLPFLSLDEAVAEFDLALRNLDERSEHRLQGFDRVPIWRLNEDDQWKPQSALPDYLADRIAHLQWDSRMEKPRERWERLIVDTPRTTLHESALFALLADQALVRFSSYSFRFEHERTEFVYLPSEALLPHLTEGEQYLVWFHRQDMANVYLSRRAPHLGYVGKMTRFTRVRRGDLEAASETIATMKRAQNAAVARVQDARLDTVQRRGMVMAENTERLNELARAAETERDVIDLSQNADSAGPCDVASEMVRDAQTAREDAREKRAADRVIARRVEARGAEVLDDLLGGETFPEPAPPERGTDHLIDSIL
jgi:hypothetical protein